MVEFLTTWTWRYLPSMGLFKLRIFLAWVVVVCVCWGIGPLLQIYQIYDCRVIHSIFFFLFYPLAFWSDNPHFIPVMDYLCLLSFLCLFYQCYWSFRELGYASFCFIYFLYFQFHWFQLITCIISFSWLLWFYFPLCFLVSWVRSLW